MLMDQCGFQVLLLNKLKLFHLILIGGPDCMVKVRFSLLSMELH
jgi:hypothetical protein